MDDMDDHRPLQYVDTELAPQNKPVGHPHVIQGFDEESDDTNLRLADGIVTTLYNLSRDVLKVFLDVNAPSIEVSCKRSGPFNSVFMTRRQNGVTCGFISNEDLSTTSNYSQSIDSAGKWKAESARTDWGYSAGSAGEGNRQIMEEVSATFARQLLYDKIWRIPKADWKVYVDGELRNDLLNEQSG